MKAKKVESGWFIRLDRGEEVMQTLIDFIYANNIAGGTITGIGALTKVELGYFDLNKKEYLRRRFEGVYELLKFSGNIAYAEDKPIVHAHCLIGDSDYKVHGGHLFNGIIAVTGEIYIREFNENIKRSVDPEVKLKLLDF